MVTTQSNRTRHSYTRQTLSLLTALLVAGSIEAGPIDVDGNWSDWGINPNGGDWDSTIGFRLFYENSSDSSASGAVGPGVGGQFFDVEAVYGHRVGNNVYFAVITGFDPDGVMYSGKNYFAGDVFLDVGTGWNVAIDLKGLAVGSTVANVYQNPQILNPNEFPASGPYQAKVGTGTFAGTADLWVEKDGVKTTYSSGPANGHHYLIEGHLDLSLVGGQMTDTGIHWTMSCGNDVGDGYLPKPTMPEPATLGLLSLGSLLAAMHRRRRRTV